MDQNFNNQEKEETLSTPGVFDKYQTAGKIADIVLQRVIAKIAPDSDIAEVCAYGDAEINGELSKVFNKKSIEKGIAFPTCLSPNSMCGHYSPLKSESQKLNQGDVVKIVLGVQIDGYVALVGHTVVVGQTVVQGRQADVILAAYKGLQAAFRLLKAGNNNYQVTDAVSKIAESYGCSPLEGVLSHEVKRHFLDGNKVILNRETADQHVEEVEFQVNDVFALDVIVSTGDGHSKESDFRTTVYKRALERQYQLKTKHGRSFMAEVIEKYPALCFSLRLFEDEITAKLAVQECQKHELLNAYPVLVASNDIIAQFTMTVAINPTSTIALTGIAVDETKLQSDKSVTDPVLVELLAQQMDKNSQKKSKKPKAKETEVKE